jgi:hypothetical protein
VASEVVRSSRRQVVHLVLVPLVQRRHRHGAEHNCRNTRAIFQVSAVLKN